VEVGVDVPNATVMVIENAERFGLSQLHQLRGRIGRGAHESFCVLISDAQNEESLKRLDILCSTADGFKIAEEDFKMRGPGDFFGSRQHGLPELKIADFASDARILYAAQDIANRIIKQDPLLEQSENALLRSGVERLFEKVGNIHN
jgi:ATP-dependent DNA helicase RecG